MDTKKKLINISRRGRILPSARWPYWEFGKYEAGKKGSKGQRQADAVARIGNAEAQQDDGDQEQVGIAGASYLMQHAGQYPPGRHDDCNEKSRRLEHEGKDRLRLQAGRARQQRHGKHHGNGQQVLKDEYPQGCAAMGRVDFAAVLQGAHHDGRAAQGDDHADKDGRRGRQARKQHTAADQGECRRGLNNAAEKQHFFYFEQALKAEFDADGEHQQHNADFRHLVDRMNGMHDMQPGRADQNAYQQKTDNGGYADPVAQEQRDGRNSQYINNIKQQTVFHDFPR